MKDLFAYLIERPYLIAIIAVLLIATVIMWIKALASSQRHRAENEATIARLEKEKALRNDFRTITDSSFETDDNERLLCGVAANIQMYLEKQTDMNAAYEELCEEKKFVYALNYVFEDGKDSELSQFFRANGQPLTGEAKKAVEKIIGGKFAEIFTSLYKMIDDDCEDASYDSEKIAECDKEYGEIMTAQKAGIFSEIADYIKENKQIFMN